MNIEKSCTNCKHFNILGCEVCIREKWDSCTYSSYAFGEIECPYWEQAEAKEEQKPKFFPSYQSFRDSIEGKNSE